ncbi:hypothetical protein EVAR_48588_1 [Eumeta japonica]|uniref:Uncharacterized protein n=1 Tax=Eumeta variegata TaxID=151549 RepID=A0A4C1YZ55_EUMVA|nr:hypothetical protein EVAR_48588_1 [Eumeta japonica]
MDFSQPRGVSTASWEAGNAVLTPIDIWKIRYMEGIRPRRLLRGGKKGRFIKAEVNRQRPPSALLFRSRRKNKLRWKTFSATSNLW